MAKKAKTPHSKKKFVPPTPRRGSSADVLRVQAGAQKAGIALQTGLDKAIVRGLEG